MLKFCCKHCGMITDNPEILPVGYTLAGFHYEIKCPVCQASTDFFRDTPFPTDKPELGDMKIEDGVVYRYVKAGEDIIVLKSE